MKLSTIQFLLMVVLTATQCVLGEDVAPSRWVDAMIASYQTLADQPHRQPLPNFGESDFTAMAWIQTTAGGTIIAKVPRSGGWVRQGKALFVSEGRVVFDIGWVGCITSTRALADGQWHHVALVKTHDAQRIFVDGQPDATGDLHGEPDKPGWFLKVGRASGNFGGSFHGLLDDVRLYSRALSPNEVRAHYEKLTPAAEPGLVGYWPFDGDGRDASDSQNALTELENCEFAAGKFGQALKLVNGWAGVAAGGADSLAAIWARLEQEFPDVASQKEMNWERADGIWDGKWRAGDWAELARRYARATDQSAPQVTDRAGALKTREAYLQSWRRAEALAALASYDLTGLRAMIRLVVAGHPTASKYLQRLNELEDEGLALVNRGEPLTKWCAAVDALRREALVTGNPLFDFDQLVFVKRKTYQANHYYTEYINSPWTPGGNLCVLDLKTGAVREVVPRLQGGVFERFDVSFDAKRIVFAWKASAQVGYRIYEVNVDGTGLRQLTFPPPEEDELVKNYRVRAHYHHGTDDMQPCYLPDGGIAFISTRCQYGILCDPPDDFTTTVLYRMDGDGKNLKKLSNSSVSEASPVMIPDGRILYTRWEYVDKGAVSVKCLWAMRPDGTASSEIYGNDIALPPTLIYGRPIPGTASKFVVCGAPHYPQNGIGPVIRLDMDKDIRTRAPMTYLTPYVDIRGEGGFAFRDGDGPWRGDGAGKGPLFKDPYPLSETFCLVAHKPAGPEWNNPTAYGLYLLDEQGRVVPVYRAPEISCWLPYPLKPRPVPPVLTTPRQPELAKVNQALCVVADVYQGLHDVPRGSIRYIRILEQVPRPWAARRRWTGDDYDQQHACVTKDTHLGLKVQHGIVPVEEDGSAWFIVPAEKNIFLQVLDANYMAVQTERTYVNYMPGEVRGCVGCHEVPKNAPALDSARARQAMRHPPSIPGPQPGETSGQRVLDYVADVQPVWDRHCVKCHGGEKPAGQLDLSGAPTALFNVSYENLVPERRRGRRDDRDLLGPVIGENHPKTGNVDYLPARSLGSHASVLVAMLNPGNVRLADPAQAVRARKLAEVHCDLKLRPEELLKVTNWVDTNCQFYGTYWGRKNLAHKDHPDYRPVPTFEMATSMVPPVLSK